MENKWFNKTLLKINEKEVDKFKEITGIDIPEDYIGIDIGLNSSSSILKKLMEIGNQLHFSQIYNVSDVPMAYYQLMSFSSTLKRYLPSIKNNAYNNLIRYIVLYNDIGISTIEVNHRIYFIPYSMVDADNLSNKLFNIMNICPESTTQIAMAYKKARELADGKCYYTFVKD